MKVVLSSRLPVFWFAVPGVVFAQPDLADVARSLASRPAFRRAVGLTWLSVALLIVVVSLGGSILGCLFMFAVASVQTLGMMRIAARVINDDA